MLSVDILLEEIRLSIEENYELENQNVFIGSN